ncbi:MAG: hypothetical protein V1651_00750 [Patescibacteria group bacterium]
MTKKKNGNDKGGKGTTKKKGSDKEGKGMIKKKKFFPEFTSKAFKKNDKKETRMTKRKKVI